MCTRPILIKNKKYRNVNLPPRYKYIHIPCGECEECQKAKSNSIYIRTRMEYDRAIKKGGIGFMCCLTYEPNQRPKIKIGNKEMYVFNKKHVQDFIKRLRTNLDRKYKTWNKTEAPDFKYLITSEFGEKKGAPHYHGAFIFEKPISITLFKRAFKESIYNRETGNAYLGYILQCDVIDSRRGGIRYCAKYICKDIGYKKQEEYIKKQIKKLKHELNIKYNINEKPKTDLEYLENRCKRANQEYKKDVERYIRPLRHMLQFCMLSNDMGGTAIAEKYTETIQTHETITVDGYQYAIPRIALDKYEKKKGYEEVQKVKKNIFINNLQQIFNEIKAEDKTKTDELNDLLLFAKQYIYSINGRLQIITDKAEKSQLFREWDEILDEFKFYEDNDFFTMCERIEKLMDIHENGEITKIKHTNNIKQFKNNYEKDQQHRQNKGYF